MLSRQLTTKFDVSENRRVTFYAAVFNEPSDVQDIVDGKTVYYREVILPGAFTKSLGEPIEVVANVKHRESWNFARKSDGSLLLQQDPHGLFASAWIPETPLGDEIISDIQSGKLRGASFKFQPLQSRDNSGIVERQEMSLHDVTLTDVPQYDATEVHLREKHIASKWKHAVAKYKFATALHKYHHSGESK